MGLEDFSEHDRLCAQSLIAQGLDWGKETTSSSIFHGILLPPFHRLCFALTVCAENQASVVFVLNTTAVCTTLSAATWTQVGLHPERSSAIVKICGYEVSVRLSESVDVLGTDFLKLSIDYSQLTKGICLSLS